MSNLDTIQYAGEITTKEFEKMDEKEKSEGFNNLIDRIEENNSIKRLKDKRDSMTEDQKLKLYKMNAITIAGYLKNYPIYRIYSSIINGTKNTAKNGGKNALKYSFLEHTPCRFFVELGILSKPEGITEDKLSEDIKRDAKNFNTYLGICKTVCSCIPETKAAVPFISMAKKYTKWYKDHGTEVVISRLNQKKQLAVKEKTNQELIEAMKDNKKS